MFLLPGSGPSDTGTGIEIKVPVLHQWDKNPEGEVPLW